MAPMPEWRIPADLQDVVDAEEMWESEDFSPILLTVMGGTVYRGRDIPLSWQIEFEPGGDEFAEADARLRASGRQADGYGWCDAIVAATAAIDPRRAAELHTGDTETAACVIWVESEEACRALTELTWGLINGDIAAPPSTG